MLERNFLTHVKGRKAGRPPIVDHISVFERARELELTLEGRGGPIDWDGLLQAKTEEEVGKIFRAWDPNLRQFYIEPLHELILQAVGDESFPKRDRKAQIRFIAESIAGPSFPDENRKLGRMSFYTSRDICSKIRNNPPYRIIRREFNIECTCGYKGPARDDACPECGTRDGADYPFAAYPRRGVLS